MSDEIKMLYPGADGKQFRLNRLFRKVNKTIVKVVKRRAFNNRHLKNQVKTESLLMNNPQVVVFD